MSSLTETVLSHRRNAKRFGNVGVLPALALILAGSLLCLAAVIVDAQLLSAFGVATVIVANVVFLMTWRTQADAKSPTASLPIMVTDASGRLLRPFRTFAIGEPATDALNAVVPDGARIGFAMVSALSQQDTVLRHIAGHDGQGLQLMLQKISERVLHWQVLPAPDAFNGAVTAFQDAGFGHIRVRPDGELGHMNAWLTKLCPSQPDGLADILLDLPPATGRLHRMAFDPEALLRSVVIPDRDGGCDLLLFPTDLGELSASNPDQFIELLPIPLARLDIEGRVQMANAAARKLIGDDLTVGSAVADILSGLAQPIPQRIQDVVSTREAARPEVARLKGAEIDRFFQISFSPIRLENEFSILMIANDATQLKTLEEQFVQSQKMQAVGQLAGGVAHDFNNLLTALSGHCDLLLLRHDKGDPDYADLTQIRQNANRAAGLVRQLLAFSRKQTLQPRVLNLSDVLGDLSHLLNRLLGERVTLDLDIGPNLPDVRVDLRQLEQVIMNLVVNARDAMADGGEVIVTARGVDLPDALNRDRAIVPAGQYAVIEVRDSGTGIPERDLAKVFEPFYTTKKLGEGTGLGLSTAYGIIKQTGGFIFVDSVPGNGTTFTIYLPHNASAPGEEVIGQHHQPEDVEGGEGIILLVEDEAPVRAFAARALQLRGFTVIEAASGEEALDTVSDGQEIDLVVSDVIMPGRDGPSWVQDARELRPDLRVIFMSGYAEDILDTDALEGSAGFLSKPFSLNDLVIAVKQQLEPLDQSAAS